MNLPIIKPATEHAEGIFARYFMDWKKTVEERTTKVRLA